MFLSKLTADIMNPSVRQSLNNRQDMHRTLARSFGTDTLYRLIKQRSSVQILVLSIASPDLEFLQKNGLTLNNTMDLTELSSKYRDGTVFRFNLLACPSKKAPVKGRNSRRVFLKSVEDRQTWLQRQAEKYGFVLLESHEPSAAESINITRGTGNFRITAIEYDGVLRIKEADIFWRSWEQGFGPEKAYGAGLMLLSRL